MNTKIFLDSSNAADTKDILEKGIFLQGQTTNPSYFVNANPEVLNRLQQGEKFGKDELLEAYKNLAKEISALVPPDGSVSVEVYADKNSSSDDLITQGLELNSWISNAHIKLPIIPVGLEAANKLVEQGVRVNMTLCFTQQQAAAVHAATRGAQKDQVIVSPFVSRLDKIGVDGFSLLLNIQKMFKDSDSHVQMLAASIHDVFDIARVFEEGMDSITIPYQDFPAWIAAGKPVVTENLEKRGEVKLEALVYEELDLSQPWERFTIESELTTVGLQRFADDWNNVLK